MLGYYFNQEKARCIDKSNEAIAKKFADEQRFIQFDIQSLRISNYHTNNEGEVELTIGNFDLRKISTKKWSVNYEIKIATNDRKMLLGFDCYKLIVKQTRWYNFEKDVKITNAYVTPLIQFPVNIPLSLYERVTPNCALEMIKYKENDPFDAFTKITATTFECLDPNKMLEIPIDYEAFKKRISVF